MRQQNRESERAFYDRLFSDNPRNEHITTGYNEVYELAFLEEPDGVVLDVGCGTGAHAERLARRGFDVVAVDLSEVGVRAARDRLRTRGVHARFVVADAERLPFRDAVASLTWTSLLLHHFPDWNALVVELARITRCRLVAFEPNAGNVLTWLAMNVANRYWGLSAMTPNQVAVWPRRLRKSFEAVGFKPKALHFVHRPWNDGLGGVRRAYEVLTRFLPVSLRANKFLMVVEKPDA